MRKWNLRSRVRDAASDQTRLTQVETAVDAAIGSADREFDGLKRRVEELRARCGFIMGNGDYEEREPEDSKLLSETEDLLLRAEERLGALTTHIALLGSIRDLLRHAIDQQNA